MQDCADLGVCVQLMHSSIPNTLIECRRMGGQPGVSRSGCIPQAAENLRQVCHTETEYTKTSCNESVQ